MKSKMLFSLFTTTLTLAATSAMAQSWSLTGETGLTDDNFLGTIDLQPLEFRVNNQPIMRFEPSLATEFDDRGSANIVGGWPDNYVNPDLWGSVIAGGGVVDSPNVIGTPGAVDDQGRGSFIGSGHGNTNRSDLSVIGGGRYNYIFTNSFSTTISGGRDNVVNPNANDGTIGGGNNNVIGYRSYGSTIGGGRNNRIGRPGNTFEDRANFATVPGGINNTAGAWCSFAAGQRAKALHAGTFVWADSSGGDFTSTESRQFLIRAQNGVGINTPTPQAALDVNGEIHCTVLELTSDRNAKTGFQSVDAREVLDKVVQLPLSTWQYTNAPAINHLGPMAQDFKAAFPNLGEDDKHIASVDADGVALASIQALHEMVREKDTQIASLQEEVSRLKSELAKVNSSVSDRLAALEKTLSGHVLQAGLNPASTR